MSTPILTMLRTHRPQRTAAVALAALIAAIGLLAGFAQPASAATQTYRNEATGQCLEDVGGGEPRTSACVGVTTQQWNVKSWNDGTKRFQNAKTGECLHAQIGTGTGVIFLRSLPCNDSEQQSWWVKRWSDGTIRFQNEAFDWCIQDPYVGGLAACDSSENQSWH
ncbi:ricin-type beta-trefoil lectin protein [Nocardioides albertanoniae]|uniref:Ricin-type beta-trefoil lectin protein n=1 Tax=Nocardioides albertanoniae TaxID=1175486 RepID=A0A543A0T8_9ACTN|nr:RICIN domain-containing protein [Nocardioides albertanoniae]TQL66212.1 ricin-type beta-trefoil lectin protein [Nocardioides albertanoniae]